MVTHTLDKVGRTRATPRTWSTTCASAGIGDCNLDDLIRIGSSDPGDPMGQLAVVLLALFAQMEQTYTLERAAYSREVATAKGRRTGRPSVGHRIPTRPSDPSAHFRPNPRRFHRQDRADALQPRPAPVETPAVGTIPAPASPRIHAPTKTG
ncbi:hypothetical protein [Rhodococcus sp. NPDC058514]|uniref:hypothetical protein n=1 Tax=unclassified Rhodococcus (in: high G+C Gram-positive bacteria) TaxID=192944 RepID=UPI0036581643